MVGASGPGRHRRPAVLRAVGHGPAPAALVLANGRSQGRRPVLPLRREQRRKPAGAAGYLLVEPFATRSAQARGWSVGFWALAALVAACGYVSLRRPKARDRGAAREEPSRSPVSRSLVRPRAVDRAGAGAVRAAAGRDAAPRHRCRVGPAALGGATGALPGHLHGGVFDAGLRKRPAVGGHCGTGRAARPGALAGGGTLSDPADHAGAPRGIHRAGDAVPHTARREPAGPHAPHRLLRVRLAWRGIGRRGRGPRRAGRVLLDPRVPARDRRGDPPPASDRRRGPQAKSPAGRWAWRAAAAMLFVAGYWGVSASTRAPRRPAALLRASFAIPAALLLFTPRAALLFAGTAAGLLVGAGSRQNRRRSPAPRTLVLRRPPGHVHSRTATGTC